MDRQRKFNITNKIQQKIENKKEEQNFKVYWKEKNKEIELKE